MLVTQNPQQTSHRAFNCCSSSWRAASNSALRAINPYDRSMRRYRFCSTRDLAPCASAAYFAASERQCADASISTRPSSRDTTVTLTMILALEICTRRDFDRALQRCYSAEQRSSYLG